MQRLFGADKMDDTIGILSIIIIVIQLVFLIGSIFPTEKSLKNNFNALQQYLVNNKGEIDFPVIGRLKVGGLTKNEAEDLIREQLQPYLKESPIVTVRTTQLTGSTVRR